MSLLFLFCTFPLLSVIFPRSLYRILISNINLGDEICDCYIDLRQSKEQRRKELLENFRFLCSCPACSVKICLPVEESTYQGDTLGMRKHNTEMDLCSSKVSTTDSGDNSHKNIRHKMNSILDYGKSCDRSYIDQSIEKSTVDDDASRLHAATFEDESIAYITRGLNQRALRVLIQGIAVLTREENKYWSVRYLSSAHLSVYQILNQIIIDKQSNEKSISYSGSRQNDNNSYHKSNNDSKRKRSQKSDIQIINEMKLKGINGADDEKSSLVTQMRYHLTEAHSGNISLQGSSTPDSINTMSLMKKHNLI